MTRNRSDNQAMRLEAHRQETRPLDHFVMADRVFVPHLAREATRRVGHEPASAHPAVHASPRLPADPAGPADAPRS